MYLLFFLMTGGLFVNLNVPLYEVCNAYNAKDNLFIDKFDNEEVKFDVVKEFAKGIKLGAGAFGVVKRVQYPSPNGSFAIALKEVNARDSHDSQMIAKELAALSACNSSNHIPKFFGCSYLGSAKTGGKSKVYIALQLLDRDLDSATFKKFVKQTKKSEALTLFLHMFKGLRDMNAQGLAHNDIKPANMMTNLEMTNVYLIDLGLASGSDKRILMGGTPIFMPPCKFSYNAPNLVYKPKDDMYSIAISIAEILQTQKYEVFKKEKSNDFAAGCIKNGRFELSKLCHTKIIENVKRILKNAGYGQYVPNATKETINFTTLIANMAAYDSFALSVKDVIEVIESLIANPNRPADDQAQKDADAVLPAVNIKEELKKEEQKIKAIEAAKKKKEEELEAKKKEFKIMIKKQELLKKQVKEKPEEVKKIQAVINDSRKKYNQEAKEKYKEINQAKKDAEDLISEAKKKDKLQDKDDLPVGNPVPDFVKPVRKADFLNLPEIQNQQESELESELHIKPEDYKEGLKRIQPVEIEEKPVELENDPILTYYKITTVNEFDLFYLVPRLHQIKNSTQVKLESIKKRKLIGAEVVIEKERIEREEQKDLKSAKERARFIKQQRRVNKGVPKKKGKLQI